MRNPDLWSTAQAAEYIGMSVSWLTRAGTKGPPRTRIGGKVFYLKSNLDTFLLLQTEETKQCHSTSPTIPDSGTPVSRSTEKSSVSPLGKQIAERQKQYRSALEEKRRRRLLKDEAA